MNTGRPPGGGGGGRGWGAVWDWELFSNGLLRSLIILFGWKGIGYFQTVYIDGLALWYILKFIRGQYPS